jgi:hypothetical protein
LRVKPATGVDRKFRLKCSRRCSNIQLEREATDGASHRFIFHRYSAMQVRRRRVSPSLAASLKSRTYCSVLAFFLILLCLGSASGCPYFQTPDSTGNCVCAVNGNPPDVNGNCPIPQLCVSTESCCAPGQLTNTGACCPQGQMPFTDGSCITMNQLIAKTMANDGLCPLQYETYQSNGTCLYSPRTPGYGTACTIPPPLPIPSYGRPGGGPVIVAVPCCMPGQLPATTSYSPSPNDPPYLLYTGACCPVGQVPQPNGSCLPAQSFVSTCPGGGAFNAQTNSCCPPGNSITNKYVCCPPSQSPQVDGSCGCPPAQVQQSDGSCLPLCNANSIPSPIGDTCTYCPPGQIGTSQGVCCEPNQATTNGFCCPAGWNPQGTACNRPPMWRAAPNTRCGASGSVPREAFAGDTVCVEPRVHDQAIADNIAAPSRTKPDGSCVRGYVWREASASDHTCVLPATRAQTWSDNRRQCGDERCTAHGVPTVTEHPQRTVLSPNLLRGGATLHRWTGHRTTTHVLSGRRVVLRGSGLHPLGGGGGFRAGSFRGGGGGRRR